MQAFRTILAESNMLAYLAMMAPRLVELHRVLKDTGSLYLHCDPTASHYLKILLDAVFGPKGFRNEIVWKRTSAHNDAKRFGRIHDVLLYYVKDPRKVAVAEGEGTWGEHPRIQLWVTRRSSSTPTEIDPTLVGRKSEAGSVCSRSRRLPVLLVNKSASPAVTARLPAHVRDLRSHQRRWGSRSRRRRADEWAARAPGAG